ncbi:hypothetical protein GCM10029992_51830 [Glycomyces albus]
MAAVSAVLAAVTTGEFEGEPVEIEPGDITTATTGLEELGMVTVETAPTGAADGVVILGGGAASDSDAEARNTGVVTITAAFAVDAPTIYATTSSGGEGNPIAALRDDDSEVAVSTVDNANLVPGQIATVAALSDQMADGSISHLGKAEGNEGLLPAGA